MSLFHGDLIGTSNKFHSALQLPLRQRRPAGWAEGEEEERGRSVYLQQRHPLSSPGFHRCLSLSEHLNSCLGLSTPNALPRDCRALCPMGEARSASSAVVTRGSKWIPRWEGRWASLNGPGECIYKIHDRPGAGLLSRDGWPFSCCLALLVLATAALLQP